MPVIGLDHVNIRTLDAEESARFYVEVLGFAYHRGPEVMGHQAHWLCDNSGRPIIHLRLREPDGASTGPVDHVALACQGKADMVERLTARSVEFSMAENLLPGITQIFLKDPHGIAIELQFSVE